MLKIILVDDEPKAVKGLAWQINEYFKDVNIAGTFTNPKKAIDFLKNNTVDCVFLDVEMPGIDGFSFLEYFEYINFKVVYVTAFSSYAIQAIKKEAKDYLLKPVEPAELIDIITKLKEEKNQEFKIENQTPKRIAISTEGKLTYVKYDHILYCESDGNYCKLHLKDQRIITVSKKIKDIQKSLSTPTFYRMHNSYLINTEKVKEYLREGYVVLENQIKVPVSRQKRAGFLQIMQ